MSKHFLSLILFTTLSIGNSKGLLSSNYDHLVVFGDSHSDNGFDDGHGFELYSNGKVWPEYLADRLEVQSLEVRAWGGAFSGMGNEGNNAKDWSGLLWQVQQYAPSTNMDSTLIIIEIGFNDLHDPNYNISPTQVVDNIISAMSELSSKGAKRIILWNLNTSLVPPAFTNKNYHMYDYYKDKIEFAQKQFKIFNTIIEDSVIQYNSNQNNIRVDLFDADYEITEISKKFEDITTPYKNSKYYPKQGKWFWFDQWHFMTETHKYIAEQNYLSL